MGINFSGWPDRCIFTVLTFTDALKSPAKVSTNKVCQFYSIRSRTCVIWKCFSSEKRVVWIDFLLYFSLNYLSLSQLKMCNVWTTNASFQYTSAGSSVNDVTSRIWERLRGISITVQNGIVSTDELNRCEREVIKWSSEYISWVVNT